MEEILKESIFNDEKSNIFLTGIGAGTGKTYSIHYIREEALSRNIKIGITSSTGITAVAISGMTIHKWSGIGIENDMRNLDEVVKKIYTRNSDAKHRILDCEMLIIDEISMIGANTLDMLDAVIQRIRKSDKPFGGIQLILVGDFMQISAVNDDYAFKSEVWDYLNLQIIQLTTPYRFTDMNYFEILQRIRTGKQNQQDIEILKTRKIAYQEFLKNYKPGDIKPSHMFSRNIDVDKYNLQELNLLPGKPVTFLAFDQIVHVTEKHCLNNNSNNINTNNNNVLGQKKDPRIKLPQNIIEEYKKTLSLNVPSTILLKINAQVMLTRNIDIDSGLANGSRGIVTEIGYNFVNVKFLNDKVHKIEIFETEYEDSHIFMKRKQIPLILCFATSIHKAQGVSLDFAVINIDNSIFLGGMAYVALSRVRSLDGLLLINFDEKKLYPDPDALKFEIQNELLDE